MMFTPAGLTPKYIVQAFHDSPPLESAERSVCVPAHAVRELRDLQHVFAIMPLFVCCRYLDSMPVPWRLGPDFRRRANFWS
eukprot:2078723-Prymnesium_polylepis.1